MLVVNLCFERDFMPVELGNRKANLILQSDTVWHYSSGFVRIGTDNNSTKPLQTLVGMTSEYC